MKIYESSWNKLGIYSMTVRLYCICGAATKINSNVEDCWQQAAEWRAKHEGEGHEVTDPKTSYKMRRRNTR